MTLSVVTVSFNASSTIEDTIRSVAAQSHSDREHIIVDGASTDGTVEIIKRNKSLLSKWISEPDNGLYDAMNKGLSMASGEYVGFLNADDLFATPHALSEIAEAIDRNMPDAVFADSVIVDPNDITRVRRYYTSRSFQPWQFRFGHMPPHSTTYIRRDLLNELGGFKTRYDISADFELLARVFVKKSASYVQIPKTLTIQRAGGVSTQGLKSTLEINRQINRCLKENNIYTNPLILWSRYILKIFQYIRRPKDY